MKILITIISCFWVLFHLASASVLIIDSSQVRQIHLAFALVLTFLYFGKKIKSSLTNYKGLIVFLILLASFLPLFYSLLYNEAFFFRAGNPQALDIVMGSLLFVFLLWGCYLSIGLPIVVVAGAFSLYAFLGPYLPSFIAFKGVSLERFIGQIYMSDEGIFGIPLDVSAHVVFLFVLFGALLDRAGGGRYFIQLALSILGRFKGGAAKAAVLGSGLTGMVSGSSIANIVTTGTFTIPLMKKIGYPSKKAAAIEVAASTDGQIAPPIMGAAAFIIAATIPNTTYFDVVKAAIVPAFVSYSTLFFLTHLEANRLGIKPLDKKYIPSFWKTLVGGLHYLLPLFFLIYQLVVLRSSPTKASFYAVVVMMAVIFVKPFIKSKETIKETNKEENQEQNEKILNDKSSLKQNLINSVVEISEAFTNGCKSMLSVALATAGAGIIVAVVSLGLGGQINTIVEILSFNNLFLILIITALASLIIGMGIPTTATYVVMASLTVPAIVTLSAAEGVIVPLIVAHLFCFYFGILADDTPPVGLAAYAASAIAGSKPIPTGIQAFSYDVRTAILPFMFFFNTDIILHNITDFKEIILIALMTMLASFSFTAMCQNFFIVKNKIHESVLFLLAAFILFLPRKVGEFVNSQFDFLPNHILFWYTVGLGLYLIIYALQKQRYAKQKISQ